MLGNWSSIKTDSNGNGTFDSDEVDERNHDDPTDANELDQRKLKEQGASGADLDLALTYDKAGNLATEQRKSGTTAVDWTYTHDAWNRLVLVEAGASDDDRAIFEYNGLNWCIIKQSDTDADDALRLAIKANPGGEAADNAVKDLHSVLDPADNYGGRMSFRYIAPFSIIIIIVFGILYMRDKKAGGYKVETISTE